MSVDDRLQTSDDPTEPIAPEREGSDESGWPTATARPLGLIVSYPAPTVCVVQVAGELDTLTAPVLADCVREQLAAGPVQLVIDMEGVTFLGSAALSTLLQCSRWLETAVPGSKLHLSGTHRRIVSRPLELVGLLPLFNVHTTLAEALAQLGARPDTPQVARAADTSAGSLVERQDVH